MTDDGFRLPRSSYDEVCKILQAYRAAGENATLADVARFAAMHSTVVSRNNKFLIDAGLVTGGQRKSLTALGEELARALEHEQQGEIRRHWRAVAGGNPFMGQLLSAIRIRGGMDPDALISHIAFSAGERKSKDVMTGARTLVSILLQAALIKEEEGTFVAVKEPAERPTEEPGVSSSPGPVATQIVAPRARSTWSTWLTPLGDIHAPNVSIQIQVQIAAKDLDTLAPRVRRLIRELAEPLEQTPESPGDADHSNGPANE